MRTARRYGRDHWLLPGLLVLVAIIVTITREDGGLGRRLFRITQFEVGDAPGAVLVGDDEVWVSNQGSATVTRLDLATGETLGSPARMPNTPAALALAERSLWVGSIAGELIANVDASSGEVLEFIEIGRTPQSLAVGEGFVWVTAFDEGTISRIPVEAEDVVGDPFETPAEFPSALAVADGDLWIADVVDDVVVRVDATSLEVKDVIQVGSSPTALAAGEGGVWVANFGDRSIMRIDPATGRAGEPIDFDGPLGGIAAGEGFVWVAFGHRQGRVVRIDPTREQISGGPIIVGPDPQGIDIGNGSVWVANQGDDTVTRIELLRSS